MDIYERLTAAGGVAKVGALIRTRTERGRLNALVASGTVLKLGHGWYALPDTPVALLRARRLNAAITCVSAAAFYEWPDIAQSTAPVHLAVPRQRGSRRRPSRPRSEVVIHRESDGGLPTGETVPLAEPVEALARVLRCAAATRAIAMVDAALNRRLVTREELEGRLVGPGSARARIRLAACDGRSRSGLETVARLALLGAGLQVRAGVYLEGVGEVDLVVEDVVVVECDGFAYHSGRREYREDRRRDRALAARGLVVLRFTYEDVMADPEYLVAEVRRGLARQGRLRPDRGPR